MVEGTPAETREWRPRWRWIRGVALVLVLGFAGLSIVNLIGGNRWQGGLQLLFAAFWALYAWAWMRPRTSADQHGIRHQEPFARTPRIDVRWEDVVDVWPDTSARWAQHVVVETADGERHRLHLVPPTDVEELRRLWSRASAS